MNRCAIVFFYDPEGIVDEYMHYLVASLRPLCSYILFVANGAIRIADEERLRGVTDDILCRPNEGFDAWAYKAGLERIGRQMLAAFDETLLLNHTCYGPIFPF